MLVPLVAAVNTSQCHSSLCTSVVVIFVIPFDFILDVSVINRLIYCCSN